MTPVEKAATLISVVRENYAIVGRGNPTEWLVCHLSDPAGEYRYGPCQLEETCRLWLDEQMARAAIASLREPSEAMVNAAHAGLCPAEVGKMTCYERVRREWQQGIDAALIERGGEG